MTHFRSTLKVHILQHKLQTGNIYLYLHIFFFWKYKVLPECCFHSSLKIFLCLAPGRVDEDDESDTRFWEVRLSQKNRQEDCRLSRFLIVSSTRRLPFCTACGIFHRAHSFKCMLTCSQLAVCFPDFVSLFLLTKIIKAGLSVPQIHFLKVSNGLLKWLSLLRHNPVTLWPACLFCDVFFFFLLTFYPQAIIWKMYLLNVMLFELTNLHKCIAFSEWTKN